MKLFILRHAKTESISTTGKDKDRKLKEKGLRQCTSIGRFLESNYPNQVWEVHCSSARRTKATYSTVKKHLSNVAQIENVTYKDELYLADKSTLLNYLSTIKTSDHPVLLIGHNDGISDLASHLIGEYLHLPTGGFVVLDLNTDSFESITSGCASLVDEFYPS